MHYESYNIWEGWSYTGSGEPGDYDYWPIGSLVVNDGCTFYGFEEWDYQGEVDDYPAENGALIVPSVSISELQK